MSRTTWLMVHTTQVAAVSWQRPTRLFRRGIPKTFLCQGRVVGLEYFTARAGARPPAAAIRNT
eukprot:4396406-Prymnesium_polylepis.1